MLSLARAKEQSPFEKNEGPERIDLVALSREILRDVHTIARARHLDYGLECPDEPVYVCGQEWLLREAIVNLVDNAVRYTPDGGMMTLRIERQAGRARVIVEDNGPGMSADDIEKAGVRFRRGQAGKNTPGAGLGLAIVQAIMLQHRGQFVLESLQPGCRATLVFTLDLPPQGGFKAKEA
jgi:two-component system sensor histidine kinase TctE